MTRTALITGGSGGIGRVCAARLIEKNYRVVLTSRREGPLAAVAESLGCEWFAADASDSSSFEQGLAPFETIDLLLHGAGILGGTFVRKESVDNFDAILKANLRSTFVTTQAVLPKMPQGGRLIFLSSTAGAKGMKGRASYSASKAGMIAFADALRDEVARDGLSVTTLLVGPVDTEMIDRPTTPLFTLQPEDVADTVAYLSDLAPRVVVPEILLKAVEEGPLAPAPLLAENDTERWPTKKADTN